MKEKYDENKVKIAFSNVKEDILGLKNEIKFIKSELLEIKNEMKLKKEVSIGNEGVQATSLQHPYNNLTTQFKQSSIEKLDKSIKDLILSLTDKEFLIFTTIYQQEDELKRPLTYEEISLKLKLSQSHVRGYILGLISKQAPLIKKRTGSKIFLSIKKEFRSLKIGTKIMDFRRSFTNQTNLSDDFNL